MTLVGRPPVPLERRYRVDENGCWIWTMARNAKGYGMVQIQGYWLAHRWVYETLVGPIPEGFCIDHLCRNTSCVNPEHMEVVTNAENMRRRYAAYETCANGHPRSPENVRPTDGRCLVCRRLNRDKHKAKEMA